MRTVLPVLVSMLATTIESVRVPSRPTPASEPNSRMLTRGVSFQGSSPSTTLAPALGRLGSWAKTDWTVFLVTVVYSATL